MDKIAWHKDMIKVNEWTDAMMEIFKEIDELEMRISICTSDRKIILANAYKVKLEGKL